MKRMNIIKVAEDKELDFNDFWKTSQFSSNRTISWK
jgi:uncharacterized protein YdhG (YjbR/CyaY superfamily)